MDGQRRRNGRTPRWPIIAAVAVPPIVAIVLAGSIASGVGTPVTTEGDLWIGADGFGPLSSAGAEDVQVAHDALHEIGEQCLKPEPDRSAIEASVDSILEFSRNFPTGRFPIDEETATATTLLVVTRDAVENCAAWAVPEVEAELPAELRRAG